MEGAQALVPAIRVLVDGSVTGHQLALLEIEGSVGSGVVRHLHAHEDEVVYVLEGEWTFAIGDAVHWVGAGACLVLPQGIEHSYVVESGPARLLVAVIPAGLERCLDEVRSTGRMTVERLITIAARYGVTITSPPLTSWAGRHERGSPPASPVQP